MSINDFNILKRKKAFDRAMSLVPQLVGSAAYCPDFNFVGTLNVDSAFSIAGRAPVEVKYYPLDISFPETMTGLWFNNLLFDDHHSVNSVSSPNAVGCNSIDIRDCRSLIEISFPELVVMTSDLEISYLDNLEEISFPKLAAISSELRIYQNLDLPEISFPSLKIIADQLLIEYSDSLTSVNFPILEIIGDSLYVNNNDLLTELEFPQLKTFNSLYLSLINITSLRFPEIVSIEGINIMAISLEELVINPDLKEVQGDVYITAGLNTQSLDNLLSILAGLDGTNGTTVFENSTIGLTVPELSNAALAAVTILQGRGCTVDISSGGGGG